MVRPGTDCAPRIGKEPPACITDANDGDRAKRGGGRPCVPPRGVPERPASGRQPGPPPFAILLEHPTALSTPPPPMS